MKPCPTIHKHPFFENSYNQEDNRQKKEVEKLGRYLKAGAQAGDRKHSDLVPLLAFPRGHKSIRVFYVFCSDCKKELFDPICSFCGDSTHTMDDAVLFEIDPNHDKAYKKAKTNLAAIKNPNYKPS